MTMSKSLDDILRQWTGLGAGFNIQAAKGEIDLERLLLDTARLIPGMARLYIMAATWLHTYGEMIAKHRLKRLIREELEPEHWATMGLLLETAQQGKHPKEFESITKRLKPTSDPKPLFEQARQNPKLAALAERRASDLSRKWRRWAQPIDFKKDAIRPANWLIDRLPAMRTRADFRGDLRASILAALRFDVGAGESEVRLAECAGGSRAQTRNALRNLEMTGRVQAQKAHGANRRVLRLVQAS